MFTIHKFGFVIFVIQKFSYCCESLKACWRKKTFRLSEVFKIFTIPTNYVHQKGVKSLNKMYIPSNNVSKRHHIAANFNVNQHCWQKYKCAPVGWNGLAFRWQYFVLWMKSNQNNTKEPVRYAAAHFVRIPSHSPSFQYHTIFVLEMDIDIWHLKHQYQNGFSSERINLHGILSFTKYLPANKNRRQFFVYFVNLSLFP